MQHNHKRPSLTRRIDFDCGYDRLMLPLTYWEGILSLPPRFGLAANSYSLLFVFPTIRFHSCHIEVYMDSPRYST